MKTSLFDMTFTLPPMVEMVKEEKEMPSATRAWFCPTKAKSVNCISIFDMR